MEKPQVTTLDNGFKIVTQHIPSKQVYTNLAVGVGSRHETEAEAGISHYLEHMLASDTTAMSAEEQNRLVKLMSGYSNASTDYDKTDYFYRASTKHTETLVKMLSDSIQNATLDPKRIEVERKAVQEEMRSALNDPDNIMGNQVMAAAYPGSGLDKDIGGDVETVGKHTRDDLVAFMKKHYTADKMTLTVVGDVTHEQIVEMAKKHFTNLPEIPKNQQIAERPAEYRGGMYSKSSDEQEQVTMQVAFKAAGSEDPKNAMADKVLANILGGGFDSRLMQSLRSDKGLVYSAYAYNQTLRDGGLMILEAGTSTETTKETMEALCEEVVKFIDTVSEEELEAARSDMLGNYERGVESVDSVASLLVKSSTVNGAPRTMEDAISNLNAVTLADVKARAKEVFSSAPCVSAFGKGVEKLPTYEEITTMLGHPRKLDASGLVAENTPSPDRSAAKAAVAGKPVEQQREIA